VVSIRVSAILEARSVGFTSPEVAERLVGAASQGRGLPFSSIDELRSMANRALKEKREMLLNAHGQPYPLCTERRIISELPTRKLRKAKWKRAKGHANDE